MVRPAWELEEKSVLICIAVVGDVSYEWACAFADLWASRVPGTSRMRLGSYVVDVARDVGVMRAIEEGYRHVLFLDSDLIVPAMTLQRLLSHNKPIVSVLYSRRHPPIYPLLLREKENGEIVVVKDYTPGSLVEVDYVPSGCLLVSTSVFQKIPRPWFFYTSERVIDVAGQSIPFPKGMSEDYYFSWKARTVGHYNLYVDTGIRALHKGTFNIAARDDGGYELVTENPNP